MKLNEIIGTQQERTAEMLGHLDLENTLTLYYPKENGYPLQTIPVKAEYSSYGTEQFPNGRISLYIDESNPEINITDGQDINIHLGGRFLATYVKNGVLVSLENDTVDLGEVDLEQEATLMYYFQNMLD